MKTERFIDAVGEIGDEYIEKYAAPRAKEKRTLPKKAWFAIAACLVLVAGALIGGAVYAQDAKEFNDAKEFFEENGLSAEGLTRAEIKAVYRDITSESFTYGKTAEVIAHDMRTNSIPGWEILTDNAAPDDVRDVWEILMERFNTEPHYEVDWRNDSRVVNGVEYVKAKDSTFRKCIGGKVLWTYRTTEMRFYFGFEVTGGVLGTGVIKEDIVIPEGSDDFEEPTKPAITKFTDDGERVWFVTWDNGGVEQQISSVTEEEECYVVISQSRDRKNGSYAVCVTRISKDGEYLGSTVNPTENDLWVCDAVAFDGGYAAIGYDNEKCDQSAVVFDKNGNLTNEYRYTADERKYRLNGIAVLGGKLYISAKLIDNSLIYSSEVPVGDITDNAKEACTAVLLICETGGGEPKVFYEVKGAVSVSIETENGKLIWMIDRVISAEKMAMYGLSVTAKGERIEYSFLEDGTLEGILSDGDVNYSVIAD